MRPDRRRLSLLRQSRMAWNMLAVCVACKLTNIVFVLLAWRLYRPVKDDGGMQSLSVSKCPVKPEDETANNDVQPYAEESSAVEIRLENISGKVIEGVLDNKDFVAISDTNMELSTSLHFFKCVQHFVQRKS